MSNKSQKIIEAAEGKTDDKALSAAAETTKPETETPKGDGKAPYREDFEAVYHRLETIERRLAEIEVIFAAIANEPDGGSENDGGDLAKRVSKIEKRLEGNIA